MFLNNQTPGRCEQSSEVILSQLYKQNEQSHMCLAELTEIKIQKKTRIFFPNKNLGRKDEVIRFLVLEFL